MTDWEKTYKALTGGSWFILLLIASLSYFTMSQKITLGVILGGLIIIANFRFLQSTMSKAIPEDGIIMASKAGIIVKSFFRLFFLGVVIYLLITRDLVNPIGLTVGLSTLFFSIVLFAIFNIWKSRIKGAA